MRPLGLVEFVALILLEKGMLSLASSNQAVHRKAVGYKDAVQMVPVTAAVISPGICRDG
jgi:hypothetical protein